MVAPYRFTAAQIEAHAEKLNPKHLEVLRLHHAQGFNYRAIAEDQGISVGTVKSRLHRGRAALKAMIESSKPMMVDEKGNRSIFDDVDQ